MLAEFLRVEFSFISAIGFGIILAKFVNAHDDTLALMFKFLMFNSAELGF